MTKWALALLVMSLAGSSVLAEEAQEMAPAATGTGSSMELLTATVGTGVENREIVGENTTFSAGEVYCLTKVQTANVPAVVHHVYSVDGKEVSDVSLDIKGSPWRTWSRKTVWPGAWKVEIKDESGAVLKAVDFEVSSAPPMPQ